MTTIERQVGSWAGAIPKGERKIRIHCVLNKPRLARIQIKKKIGNEDLRNFEWNYDNSKMVVNVRFLDFKNSGAHVDVTVWEPSNTEVQQIKKTVEKQPEVYFDLEKIEKRDSTKNIFSTAKSWVHNAINLTQQKWQMSEINQQMKEYVDKSSALKPRGWNGQRFLTLDEVDYTPMLAQLRILKDLRKKEGKPFYQAFDKISGMGQAAIVAAYLASPMGDNLDDLIRWWKNIWVKAFRYQMFEKLTRKLKILAVKTITFKNAIPEGYSRSRAEKLIRDLFIDKSTGLPLKVKDLEADIYIPVIDYDRITWPHTKSTSPNTFVADVVIDSALDPFFFQSGFRKGLDHVGVLMGAVSISPDYFIARENKDACLVSVGGGIRFYKHSQIEQTALTRGEVAASRRKITRQLELDYIETFCRDNKINRRRYAFKSLDHIREDSTNEEAQLIAYEAGIGVVFPLMPETNDKKLLGI